jgi:hypothetical protein
VAAQVRDDHTEAGGIAVGEDQLPVVADAGASVQQEQRLAAAARVVVEIEAIDVDGQDATLADADALKQARDTLKERPLA